MKCSLFRRAQIKMVNSIWCRREADSAASDMCVCVSQMMSLPNKTESTFAGRNARKRRFFSLLVSGFMVTWGVEICIISSGRVEVFQSSAALTVVALSNSHLTRVTTHPQNIYRMTSFHILLATWHRTWKKTLGGQVLLIGTVDWLYAQR